MTPLVFIALATGLLTLWKPRWGMAALIVLWPSYLWRLAIAGIPTTILELSLYAAAAAVGLRLLLRWSPWDWVKLPKDTYGLLGAWAAAWFLSTAFAANTTAALGALKAWWFDPMIFLALLIITTRTREERHLLINAAIASGAIVSLAGLIQLAGFRETLQEGRLSSFFAPVANYAAMYIGPLLVLSVSLMLHGHRSLWRWIATIVMAIALLLTLSFGGFMAVAVGVFVSWLLMTNSVLKRRLLWTGVAVVVLGTLALSQTPNFKQHFNLSGRSSGSVREQIWVTSWAIIRQHTWFGIGPNNFETAYRGELPKHYFPPLEWLVSQPHNLFLALWLETGLMGLIVFLLFLRHHFLLATKQFFKDPLNRNIAIASLAGIVAVVVHGLVDTPIFKNDLALEFALLMVIPWLGHPDPANVQTKSNPTQK